MLRRSKKQPISQRGDPRHAPIVTDHLIIREAVAADAVAMQQAMDDAVRRESGLADEELGGLTLSFDRGVLHAPTRIICEKPSGRIIGGAVTFASSGPQPPRLWLWFGPDGRDRGFDREALVAVVEHVHDAGTPEVAIRVGQESAGDLELAESVGFRRVGAAGHGRPAIELVHSRSPSPPTDQS